MAWSYSGDPATDAKDAVRFEVQDTNEKAQLLQDAEIEFALAQEAANPPDARGILAAAARCCEVLSRRFSAQADTVIGSLQITYSKQAAGYTQRAVELRNRAQGSSPPFAGGLSKSEKRALRQDTDRVQPSFRRDQFKEPHTKGREEDGGIPGGLL